MNVFEIKVCAIALVLVVSFISGSIPCVALRRVSMVTKSSSRFKVILSLVNCFSGGVFLAASLLNILPEAAEAMEPVFDDLDWDNEFPVVEAFVGVGFILVLCIETFAKECCGGHLHQHSDPNDNDNDALELKERGKSMVYTTAAASDNLKVNGEEMVVAISWKGEYVDKNNIGLSDEASSGAHPIKTEHVVDTSASNGSACHNSDTQEVTIEIEGEESEEPVELMGHAKPVAKLRMVVLAAALSIHMVFDGLAVGLLTTSSKVWQLLLPICIHKVLVFFSIGLVASETLGTLCRSLLTVFFIALVSPLGIVLGVVLTDSSTITDGTAVSAISGIVQSIAVGTFLYVTFFEILHPEFAKHKRGGSLRLFAVICGYGIMLILKRFASD